MRQTGEVKFRLETGEQVHNKENRMSSAKCPQCGVVNWTTEVSCKRCGAILSGGDSAPSPVERVIRGTNPLAPPAYKPNDYRAPAPPQWAQNVSRAPRAAAPVYAAPQPPPIGFKCPFCQSPFAPFVVQKVSTGGWIVFAVMVMFCIPLCWIGLLMKENTHVCSTCGMPLG